MTFPAEGLGLLLQAAASLKGASAGSAEDPLNQAHEELLAIVGLGPESLEQVPTALGAKRLARG